MPNELGVQEYSLYGGDVTLFYNDELHSYTRIAAEGEVAIPNVTSTVKIIDKSDALTAWAAKMTAVYMGKKLTEAAAQFALDHPEETKVFTIPEIEELLEDARKHYKEVRDEAGDIGKMAHACIEKSILKALRENNGVVTELVDIPEHEMAANCARDALAWMKAHNVRWLSTERKIYSVSHDFAGTEDGKGYVSSCSDPHCCRKHFTDVLSVIDWKSSNGLYDEYAYQTAAYEYAEEEENGEPIQDRWILRLGKEDGQFEPWHIESDEFEYDFEVFRATLNLVRRIEARKQYLRAKKAQLKVAIKAEKEAQKAAEKAEKEAAKAAAKAEKEAAKAAEKEAKAKAKAEAKAAKAAGVMPPPPETVMPQQEGAA